jgi:predicted Zn-dependent protease
MKNLPHPDNKNLEAAEGWLELGNWKEANDELEQISAEHRAHPFVLELRYKIHAAAGKWEMALAAAKSLRDVLPDNQWGHFYTAYALHELKRTQEAYDALNPVAHKFPDHQAMHYNLACYSCQLGKMKEAMQWLGNALEMPGEKDIRQMALLDHDLEPLWNEIAKN